jgi:hypothetical protein
MMDVPHREQTKGAARLTYDQAVRAAERFRGQFEAGTYVRWVFAGGIRRKAAAHADVVHVVDSLKDSAPLASPAARERGTNRPTPLVWLRLDQLLAAGIVTKRYGGADAGYDWHEHYRAVVHQGVVHRVFLAARANWGAALCACTGPASFAQRLHDRLADADVRARPGLLLADAGGHPVECPTEEHVFALAGVEPIRPEDREGPAALAALSTAGGAGGVVA